jgi:hypothetical protein
LFVHLKLNSNFECEFQTKFEFESRKEIKNIPLKQINGIIKIWIYSKKYIVVNNTIP